MDEKSTVLMCEAVHDFANSVRDLAGAIRALAAAYSEGENPEEPAAHSFESLDDA